MKSYRKLKVILKYRVRSGDLNPLLSPVRPSYSPTEQWGQNLQHGVSAVEHDSPSDHIKGNMREANIQ